MWYHIALHHIPDVFCRLFVVNCIYSCVQIDMIMKLLQFQAMMSTELTTSTLRLTKRFISLIIQSTIWKYFFSINYVLRNLCLSMLLTIISKLLWDHRLLALKFWISLLLDFQFLRNFQFLKIPILVSHCTPTPSLLCVIFLVIHNCLLLFVP